MPHFVLILLLYMRLAALTLLENRGRDGRTPKWQIGKAVSLVVQAQPEATYAIAIQTHYFQIHSMIGAVLAFHSWYDPHQVWIAASIDAVDS